MNSFIIERIQMQCLSCLVSIDVDSKFCSQVCKNKYNNSIYQGYAVQKDRGINRKLYLINKSGGKCIACGYCKNMSGLVFHHKNPEDKKFELDARNLSNRSMKTILQEHDKCELLCQICHVEHHNPQLDMSNFVDKKLFVKLNMFSKTLEDLTDEQISDTIQIINSTTMYNAADILGIDSDTLSKFLKRNNLFHKVTFKIKTKIEWPANEKLLEMINESSYLATGKILGVSDNAIRKRLKKN